MEELPYGPKCLIIYQLAVNVKFLTYLVIPKPKTSQWQTSKTI